MPRKPLAQMTPEEQEARRLELRLSQQRRRLRKRAQHLCINCGIRKPRADNVTCDDCIQRSRDHDAALGYPMRPSVQVRRAGKRLAKAGETITLTKVAEEVGFDKEYVKEVLVTHGLYEPKTTKKKVSKKG